MHTLTHPRASTSPITLLAVAAAAFVPWLLSERWWVEFGLAATFGIAAVAAVADADTGRIPDRLVGLAAVPTVLVLLVQLGDGWSAVGGAAVGLAALAGPLLVVHIVSPAAMGFGDVKLAAVLGAAVGLVDPRSAVLALCLATAISVMFAALRRRSVVPFGPGLVSGAALALIPFIPEGPLTWR